jgi:hypothetical protein
MGASSKKKRGPSPRAKFIAAVQAEISRDDVTHLAGFVWDAMQLASSHDPDHAAILKRLETEANLATSRFSDSSARVSVLERQMAQIIAGRKPEVYRRVR